jgi:hypothetical protein
LWSDPYVGVRWMEDRCDRFSRPGCRAGGREAPPRGALLGRSTVERRALLGRAALPERPALPDRGALLGRAAVPGRLVDVGCR